MPSDLTPDDQVRIERRLVENDLRWAISMLGSLVRREARGESMSWASLTYLHYLSLVAYEVRQYGRRNGQPAWAAVDLKYEDLLADSRHSTKLFADTARTAEDLLAEFEGRAVKHRNWFIDVTRDPDLIRGSEFLQTLVPDMSVVLYDDRILTTSHSISYHGGYDFDATGEQISERAERLAAFFDFLCADDAWLAEESFVDHWDLDRTVARDAWFESFYGSTFGELPLPESMALTVIGSDVEAIALLGDLTRHTPDSGHHLAFKFIYSGIWQVLDTLRKIVAEDSPFRFTREQKSEMAQLLDSDAAAFFAAPGSRMLRNVLIHYGVRGLPLNTVDLRWDDPFLGLVNRFCGGRTWRDVTSIIDECTHLIRELLDRWRGPCTDLLETPF